MGDSSEDVSVEQREASVEVRDWPGIFKKLHASITETSFNHRFLLLDTILIQQLKTQGSLSFPFNLSIFHFSFFLGSLHQIPQFLTTELSL